jgi:hypothetical protein
LQQVGNAPKATKQQGGEFDQLRVDAAKLFAMLSDLWIASQATRASHVTQEGDTNITISNGNGNGNSSMKSDLFPYGVDDSTKPFGDSILTECPVAIIRLATEGSTTSDYFLSAFQVC